MPWLVEEVNVSEKLFYSPNTTACSVNTPALYQTRLAEQGERTAQEIYF